MSDLFGGVDPGPQIVSISVVPDRPSGTYTLVFTVHESTTRRRHIETIKDVPRELLADMLEASAWWAHLALIAERGEHRGIPKKWMRRCTGRIAGWSRREP